MKELCVPFSVHFPFGFVFLPQEIVFALQDFLQMIYFQVSLPDEQIRINLTVRLKMSFREKLGNIKIVVPFDQDGVITDREIRNMVIRWQGTLAKTKVPVSIAEKWSSVPKEMKATLWRHFLRRFIVGQKYRKTCLKAMGNCWRTFKYTLTNEYIFPFKDNPELLAHPQEQYDFIKPTDWTMFVRSQLSPTFQEYSKLQSERRSKNEYNHRASRGGYVGIKEKVKKQKGTSYDLDRSELWLLARQDNNGQYPNDATREVAEKIVDISNKVKDGAIVVEGTNDILTMAIGTPEHFGHVRGVGKYYTQSNYFHIPRRTSKAAKVEAENLLLRAKIKEYEKMLNEGSLVNSLPVKIVDSNNARGDNGRRTSNSLVDQLSGGSNNKNARPSHDGVFEGSTLKYKQLQHSTLLGNTSSSVQMMELSAKKMYSNGELVDTHLELMNFIILSITS